VTDRTPPQWAAEAAANIRQSPLRWFDGDSDRPPKEVRDSGYYLGAEECVRSLEAGIDPDAWYGFGGRWPVLCGATWTVAPAVPVAIGSHPTDGPGGAYHRRASGIVREAVGIEQSLLTAEPTGTDPGAPFDLLWFGDVERWVVRGGTLEIEDLFCRARVAADRSVLDRLLVRARRLPDELIAGLPTARGIETRQVEVGRSRSLMGTGLRWQEPSAFLRSRGGVRAVRGDDSTLVAELEDGREVAYLVVDRADGWSLSSSSGDPSIVGFSLRWNADHVRLLAEVADTIDLLAPGVRGRLAFDLQSDLVVVTGQKS
jgi:hypothetical protein